MGHGQWVHWETIGGITQTRKLDRNTQPLSSYFLFELPKSVKKQESSYTRKFDIWLNIFQSKTEEEYPEILRHGGLAAFAFPKERYEPIEARRRILADGHDAVCDLFTHDKS